MSNPEPQLSALFKKLNFDTKWIEPLNDVFGDIVTVPFDAYPLTATRFTGKRNVWNHIEMDMNATRVDRWIRQQATAPGVFAQYEEFERKARRGSGIDFDDLRVREWTLEEVDAMRRHLEARDAARILEASCAVLIVLILRWN